MTRIRTARGNEPTEVRMVLEGLPQPHTKGGPLPSPSEVFWRSNFELDQSGRPWIQAALPILMRAKSGGVFDDPLDPVALANSEEIQAIYHDWWPWMKVVPITCDLAEPLLPGKGVGCFFSGGVDSFYSVLTHLEEVTHLILVKSGFDIFPPKPELSERTHRELAEAAAAYGKPLITVETNVREISSRFVRWGRRYHGAALATVGQLLQSHIDTVLVPSTDQQADLAPWGSHPAVDPLWSSSYLKVVHDSVKPSRSEKVREIIADPVAMRHLRVCWRNPDSEYNCGKCEKCVRTMISLYAFGALEQCATFDDEIDRESLETLNVSGGHLTFAVGNLALLKEGRGESDQVYRILRARVEEEDPMALEEL